MSVLHVNQIAGALHRMFDGQVDMADAPASGPDREKSFLTRALAAFAVAQLAGIVPAEAAKTIVDGSNDNGIDALHYDVATKIMYVVQSKWHSDGNGSLDRGEVLKFTKGFGDLANLQLDRFNDKVRAKEPMIKAAFADDQATYVLVPIHTGAQDFGAEPRQDLEDCLTQYNDTSDPDASDLLTVRILKQSDVHGLVARGVQGTPIDIDIALFEWGEAKDPFSVYGQVAASDIAGWWKSYYPQIVSQNIRMFLGTDTEVNTGLQTTLLLEPHHFWHFNNGITVICREIRPKMLGGRSKDSGYFTCYDVQIVNGAQTAGSTAAVFSKKPEVVDKARVHVRFIAVGSEASDTLGNAITKATNTQNRINRQDFVSLDPEQQRLRTELSIEGIIYNYKTGEGTVRDPKTSDIDEATVALACASPDLGHSTQAKREIGKLWDDTSKPPYKALFNPSVSGLKMWHCVQIMRQIDTALQAKLKVVNGRDSGFLIHGNRCMAHLTFQKLPAAIVNASSPLPPDIEASVSKHVDEVYAELKTQANALYPQAYLAQLFKNQKELTEIKNAIAKDKAADLSMAG
jgi:AIPR protein